MWIAAYVTQCHNMSEFAVSIFDDTMGPMEDRGGRPSSTSPHELAAAAQRLFLAKGFDETSVEEIASAVGVSRRTFFRYFPTKADVLWVESPTELASLRDAVAAADPATPYEKVLATAIVDALRYPPDQREWEFQRAQLVLTVPSVQGNASIRFDEWRGAAAEFVARRTGGRADDLFPIAVGNAVIAAMVTAHHYWITHPESELEDALTASFALLLPRT